MSKQITMQDVAIFLAENGLALVPIDAVTAVHRSEKKMLREKLLKKRALTFSEVLKLDILPIKSRQALAEWVKKRKINPDAVYTGSDGKRRIFTEEIIKLSKYY